jgi:hypothetical protein
MATKTDPKAQKERKQKIILAVGGVLLLAVLAFELPGLLSHSSSSATPATTAATPTDGTATTPAPTAVPSGTPAPVNVSASKVSAQVAGVALVPAAKPSAAVGQLWSFTRFKQKDPFVQQVKDTGAPGSGTGTSSGSPSASPTVAGGKTSPSGAPTGSPSASPAATPVLAYATLLVNGRPQQLTLKQLFPKADPIFVLAKVGDKMVRIGVAGGAFTGGQTMMLVLGKRVTLMNTSTGQRYVVKLVYVGAQPETIAAFKGGPATTTGSTASNAPAVAGSTP